MQTEHLETDVIELPAPTAWPMVLALGAALVLAGMVTHVAVALLGLILVVSSGIGWFVEVLPREKHEGIPIVDGEAPITSSRTLATRLTKSETQRKILPIETFRLTNGLQGGIAGGIAMVIPATVFSLIRYHSIWYAMNLLAAGGFQSWAGASNAFLSEFHLTGFLAALAIHGLTSILVGLLYGAMLPMFPRLPILSAGFVAPLLITGILHSALNIVSPILNQRIEWFWFVLSQIAFGLVCGFVVNLHAKVRTPQFQSLPFSMRAGIHSNQGDRDVLEDKKDGPR